MPKKIALSMPWKSQARSTGCQLIVCSQPCAWVQSNDLGKFRGKGILSGKGIPKLGTGLLHACPIWLFEMKWPAWSVQVTAVIQSWLPGSVFGVAER